MGKIDKTVKYICFKPQVIFTYIWLHLSPLLPVKLYISVMYRLRRGYWMDFKNPVKFNEKLQWLKLHDHKSQYIKMVDKYEAKKYVAEIIGDEYIIPTIGVWDSVDDIDFNSLPDQFVLKCTHDSGGLVICKDKKLLNFEEAKQKIKKSMASNYYNVGKEWPYKYVKRRIIAEQYVAVDNHDLTDYKFYCFGGEPKYCQVINDRSTKETIDFFDTEWNHQEFVGLNTKAGNAEHIPERPMNLKLMLKLASSLSEGISFSRIDLYEIGRKCYFGEITFFPASGFGKFTPEEFDDYLGSLVHLTNYNNSRKGTI